MYNNKVEEQMLMWNPLLILATEDIVTDLIRALPGNNSVNSPTYTGGQQNSRSVF
jgi:hypothetical protein